MAIRRVPIGPLTLATTLAVLLVVLNLPWKTVSQVDAASQTLRIGYSTWVGYGPFFLARDRHLFPGALEVKLVHIEPPKLRFDDLATAKLDGLVTTVDTMPLYWKPSSPYRAVLALDDSNGYDGIVATSQIAKIEDLRGKRVAVNPGSVSDFFLESLLRDHGLAESDLQIVSMRQNDAGKAFLDGRLDAAVTWEPWLSRANRTPGKHVLIDTSQTPARIVDVLVFRQDVILAQSDAIRAVIAGWYSAVEYWKQHPDESDALMAKALGEWLINVNDFKGFLTGIRYYDQAINGECMLPSGRIHMTAQEAIDVWASRSRLTEQVSASDLIFPQFVVGP